MYDLDVSLHVELVNLTGVYDGQAIFEVGNKNLLWKARADKMLECLQRSIGTHVSDSWSRARQAGSSVQSLNSDVSILVTSPSPAAENFFYLSGTIACYIGMLSTSAKPSYKATSSLVMFLS